MVGSVSRKCNRNSRRAISGAPGARLVGVTTALGLAIASAIAQPPGAQTDPVSPTAPPASVAPAPSAADLPPLPSSIPALAIRSVRVDGVTAVPLAQLVTAASAKTVGHIGSAEVVQSATRAVKAFYKDRGYPVAEVVGVDLTPDGVLHLTVAEGRIRRIIVRGNRKTRAGTILQALSLRSGDVYDDDQVRADRNRLARLGIFEDVIISAQVPGTEDYEQPLTSTAAKGAEVTPSPDRSDGPTPTNAGAKNDAATGAPASSPGDPKNANPAGGALPTPPTATAPPANPQTATPSPDTTTKPNPPDASGSASNPVSTGNPPAAAKAPPLPPPTMVLDALPPDEDEVGQVDLVVRVKEQQTVSVSATVGYADVIGPVGFIDVSEINLAGTAQRIGVQWQRVTDDIINPDGSILKGDSRQALDVIYDKPALGLHTYTYSVDIYDKNTVFLPYFSGVDETIRTYEKRTGVRAAIGHPITNSLTAFLLVRRESVGYDDPNNYAYAGPLPPDSFFQDAQAQIGAVGAEVVVDKRDAADNPHRGILDALTYEDAANILGGNRDYQQTTVDLRSYSPINNDPKGPIVALRLLGGYTSGDLPLPNFFFLGGFELLRGYDLYSIYGDRMLLGTAELRANLGNGVQGVLFIDDGNAWLPGTAAALNSLKLDAGVGLRFLSPIGPIRLDVAQGDGLKTYVTLGQSF